MEILKYQINPPDRQTDLRAIPREESKLNYLKRICRLNISSIEDINAILNANLQKIKKQYQKLPKAWQLWIELQLKRQDDEIIVLIEITPCLDPFYIMCFILQRELMRIRYITNLSTGGATLYSPDGDDYNAPAENLLIGYN